MDIQAIYRIILLSGFRTLTVIIEFIKIQIDVTGRLCIVCWSEGVDVPDKLIPFAGNPARGYLAAGMVENR